MSIIKINYPESGQKVPSKFVAFGTARAEVGLLNCVLISAYPPRVYFKQNILPRPTSDPKYKAWSVKFFDKVREGAYTLVVWDPLSALEADLVADIFVGGVFFGQISYPTPNCSVCQSFTSYGTTDAPDGTAVTGQITGGGSPINAPDSSVDDGSWSLDFSGVSGPNLTETVTITGDNISPVKFNTKTTLCLPP